MTFLAIAVAQLLAALLGGGAPTNGFRIAPPPPPAPLPSYLKEGPPTPPGNGVALYLRQLEAVQKAARLGPPPTFQVKAAPSIESFRQFLQQVPGGVIVTQPQIGVTATLLQRIQEPVSPLVPLTPAETARLQTENLTERTALYESTRQDIIAVPTSRLLLEGFG